MLNAKNTITLTEARKKIFEIAEKVQKPNNFYTLTERGKPKAVILSAEEFDSIIETMEIMSDPKILKKIEQAEKEYERGEYVSLDELARDFSYKKEPAFVADKPKRKYKASKKKNK
ncbi:type II toxin-antitoxin system Phd/YefM family antitoxin [Patescibacteria group bacterium]|nr:type II toxin-antitoxin system Phd/YefM family antitoxin [Patescibacteria group bacterium]